MRLFVAIDLEKDLKRGIENIEKNIRGCGCDVKLVEPDNLHITVKFLGEVPESGVNDIEGKISGALKNVKQFQIGFQGVGFFGRPDYIRTIWIGIQEGREELVKLIENMNKCLNCIRREVHNPNPHLTIGRVKSGREKEKLLETIREMKNVKLGRMPVKFVKLKKSTLTEKGPVYADLNVFELE